MKAGIITFQRAINYGAALQAYSLRRNVEKFVPCEVVDYESKLNMFGLAIKENKPVPAGKVLVKRLANRILYRNRISNFRRFYKEHNYIGDKTYKTGRDEAAMARDYNFFIAGSDQVFCPEIVRGDYNYMLAFSNEKQKKYSYSASFGALKQADLNNEMLHYLHDFMALSIREEQDATQLANTLQQPVQTHIDPVFLLTKQEWEEMATCKNEGEYILVYTMRRSDTLIERARELAARTGAKIIHIPTGLKRLDNIQYENDAGPSEFVGLFKNARYVLTNSFHGTAFSIILHKQMLIEFHTEKNNANHRFENLIKLFGLKDRVLMGETTPDIDAEIDFTAIDTAIQREQMRSLAYLEHICNEAAIAAID